MQYMRVGDKTVQKLNKSETMFATIEFTLELYSQANSKTSVSGADSALS